MDEADLMDPTSLNEGAMGGSQAVSSKKENKSSVNSSNSNRNPNAANAANAANIDITGTEQRSPAKPVTAIAVHKPGRCMVVAYEDGLVSLFPYPCVSRDPQQEVELCRVASYVSRISFTADYKTIVMIEAGSRSVIQATIPFPSTSPLLIK